MILKNEKKRLYNRMTLLLLIFHAAAVAWILFSSHQTLPIKLTGFATLALLLATFYFLRFRTSSVTNLLFVATAVMIFIYWCLSGYWWMGAITIILFFLYFVNSRELIVNFYADKIEYPSFPKRTIKWDELNNVILKDDWLTIDFKNNRIIQQFTDLMIPAGNEKEFNDFCRQLLNQ